MLQCPASSVLAAHKNVSSVPLNCKNLEQTKSCVSFKRHNLKKSARLFQFSWLKVVFRDSNLLQLPLLVLQELLGLVKPGRLLLPDFLLVRVLLPQPEGVNPFFTPRSTSAVFF